MACLLARLVEFEDRTYSESANRKVCQGVFVNVKNAETLTTISTNITPQYLDFSHAFESGALQHDRSRRWLSIPPYGFCVVS